MLDRIILVYDGDSGLGAMLLDVVKKCIGKEDCALCEITYGPLGKRSEFRACESRLGVAIDELHRDQVPPEWGLARSELPCILARAGTQLPFAVVTRAEILAFRGSVDRLEAALVAVLQKHGASVQDRSAVARI